MILDVQPLVKSFFCPVKRSPSKGYLDHVFVQDTTHLFDCAMPMIPSQVAFKFAIKFSSGRSHQLTRVDVAGEAKDPLEGE